MVASRKEEPGGSGGGERKRDYGGHDSERERDCDSDKRTVYSDSSERGRRIQDGNEMVRGTSSDGNTREIGNHGDGKRGGGESMAM